MNVSRRVELLLAAAVYAAFAAFWLASFALSKPPEFAIMDLFSATVVTIVATTWATAVRLVWRAWWTKRLEGQTTHDGPALLLAAARAALPEDRREWGDAMAAELAHLDNRPARWQFAAGCFRTALLPPGASPALVLGVALGTTLAAAATSSAVGRAWPPLQVFSATFVALLGARATLSAARTRRLIASPPAPTIAVAGIPGVAACVGGTVHFLLSRPDAAEYFTPGVAIVLAAVLAASLSFTLIPPRALVASRLARLVGLAAAAVFALGFLWSSRISIHTNGGPILWTLFAPIVVFFVTGAVAASRANSFAAGVQSAVWATLLGALATYALWLPETMHRYALDGRTLSDGEVGLPLGVNLPDALWGLIQIPLVGLPFGVFGAAFGKRRAKRRHRDDARDLLPRHEATASLLRKPHPLGGAT